MKRLSLLSAAFLMIGLLFGSQAMAQGRIDLRTNSAQQCANVTEDGFTATFSFGSIEATEVNTEKGVFSNITMDGTYPAGNLGEPSLPTANQLIAVPYGAKNVTVEVKNYSTTTYRLADYGIKTVMPQQPSVRKDQKPEDVKFVYNEKAYAAKSFSQRPLATIEMRGTMRGIQVGSLTVNPVNYNPAENTIEVYNNIEVEVRYNDYDKAAAESEFARTFSPYFASVYGMMFNWRDDVYDQHPDLWQAPVKMLVIADRMFEEIMQPWLEWKTMKGFYVNVHYTDQIGNTPSAIRSFIQEEYDKDAPTFLIIFGDKNQVPASATGSETHCVTDLQYMSVDNDDFPDIYHSRMCAENLQQMQNILDKTLLYEKYVELPNPSYLNNVLLIAGWDSYWTAYDGAPSIQYAMEYYYNAEHGFENVYNWLGQPYTGCYAPMNTGVGFVNYTAHGSNTSWADPSFTVSDVNNLTNVGMPFLAMGNCCEAADWGISSTCFGEAMIRNNQAAAYAYIGSCPSTYWYEDYYFTVGATNIFGQMPTYEQTAYGLYDAVWNDDEFNCVSAMPFIGNIAVCYAHANNYQGSVSDKYYWQAYHALGDGSVMPFRIQPTENVVSHMAVLPIGLDFFTVSAAPGSYVGISKDGVLYGAGLIGESGTADISIEPITSGGDVTVCVTCLDKIPYISVIPAAALEGAYISVDAYTPGYAHVGEEANLDITFKNVGTEATSGTTTVTLNCDANEITIINGTGSFESLNPDETITLEGFTYSIAEGVADGSRFNIQITATCGDEVWEGRATITANEAVIEFVDFDWSGSFVPGETIPVMAIFENTGHFKATNASVVASSTSQYITFENATYEVGTVDPEGVAICLFNVNIAPDCPESEQMPIQFALTADGSLTAEGSGMLKNSCNVVFELSDSYGDGWNGAKLNVAFSDGTPSQSLTISTGASETYVIEIGNGVLVSLTWTSGSWDQECSFVVKYEDGTQICQGTNLNSSWSYQFECSCGSGPAETYEPVSNLDYSIQPNKIVLTWDAPENAMAYVVMRNGLVVGEITSTTYADDVEREGSYTYCIIAAYDGANLSAPECVIVDAEWGIEEGEAEFGVYPNPASNMLTINSGNAEFSYTMFNGMGQQVATGNARGTAQVNVSGMAKGVYFLRLTTGTQTTVQKIVVE